MKKIKKKSLGMRSAVYLESDHNFDYKIYKTGKGWVCENLTQPTDNGIKVYHTSLKEARLCLY